MFLRSTNRRKDGKDHRYYSIVENHRLSHRRAIQKTLLYLGEINSSQETAWNRAIEVIEGDHKRQLKLFSNETVLTDEIENKIQPASYLSSTGQSY